MKIAFCGASGTGKTTLARMIEREFGLEFNPVGSRSVAQAMGFKSPYDVDAAGKREEFQRRLLDEKIAWEESHDSFVTDRTTIDQIVYHALHDVHSVTEELLDRSLKASLVYDVVFFAPVDAFIHTGDDPARVDSLAYHRVYEMTLTGFFRQARNLRVLPDAQNGNHEARKRSVLVTCDLISRR